MPSQRAPFGKPASFSTALKRGDNQYCEFGPNDDGFYYAVLGCVNGKNSMHMLRDHKETLQYRTVERVILMPNERLTLQQTKNGTFVILLSEPRSRPTSS